MVFDLVKSLSNKLDKNDILKDLKVKYSVGKLEIDAIIERNGKDYNLSTESIYAGGYNIQQLHIRYITKTNLPSVDNTELLKTIKDKIKKLTNVEILRKDILRLENNIVKSEKKLEALTNMSEEDVLNNSDYKKYVNQGLDTSRYSGDDMPGNIHKNQETYDAFLNDVKTYELKRHYSSIEMCKKDIINTKKNIVLIQKKIR